MGKLRHRKQVLGSVWLEEDTERQQDTKKGQLGPDSGGCWRPDRGARNASCRD